MGKEGKAGNKTELINMQMEIWKKKRIGGGISAIKAPEYKEIFHNKIWEKDYSS